MKARRIRAEAGDITLFLDNFNQGLRKRLTERAGMEKMREFPAFFKAAVCEMTV
jgi:hypothetical protein